MFCQVISALLVASMIFVVGCQNPTPEGTEDAATQYLTREFQKWIGGQKNDVTTLDYRIQNLKTPISFKIRSVSSDSPHALAFNIEIGIPETYDTFSAYRFNVVIEWKSVGGPPVETVTTYTVTWNPDEKKWYIHERL